MKKEKNSTCNNLKSGEWNAVCNKAWRIEVHPDEVVGPIKIMNAVNNGPKKARSDQTSSNFDDFKSLKIPFVRTHDAALCYSYGAHHCGDITSMFPDFDTDETDPANYDFTITDEYLETIRLAGGEPFFRLGQSIEHWIKKYGVNPPEDFEKWARICEHVIRHYNEGWADGYRWNIRYWEIWNEPDLNTVKEDGRLGPTWTGTKEQFLELYKTVSLHLRRCFNDIKIGGPAFCGWNSWKDDFLPFCVREKLPLDFYSYHAYAQSFEEISYSARQARMLLDKNGFNDVELILNEWNYVRGWSDEWVYTLECESGRFNQKGAAMIAATMIDCQNSPLDMLMYYDARIGCAMNGMFDIITLLPLKGYYPFVAWKRLQTLGTQVKTKCTESASGTFLFPEHPWEPGDNHRELVACAARNKEGCLAIFIARYSHDNNIVATVPVQIRLADGRSLGNARCHLTDAVRSYTEVSLITHEDGSATVRMQPNSFALIELD
ncbi:MAG: hypothetical protein GX804_10485 [Lentisphaerae bacterium]|nr:hypothetical protein [Lentisphaerota bacterium]